MKLVLILTLASCLAGAATASPASLMDESYSSGPRTYLIDLRQGSELSRKVSDLQGGGYESAQGAWVSFRPWYQRRHGWTDASVTLMTQISPNWGVIWGGSTGERGSKYLISPSLKMGLLFTTQIAKNAHLSIEGTTILGGRLKEKTCVADYGDIGGQQEVNCRLAASALEPAQTLQYLLDEKPSRRHKLFIRYTSSF